MEDLFALCRNHHEIWRNIRASDTLASNLKIVSAIPVTAKDGTSYELGAMPLPAVSRAVLEQVKSHLYALDYAPASVQRKMSTISRALNEATTCFELLEHQPKAKPVRVTDNARKRILSDHEEAAVWQALHHREATQPKMDWKRVGHAYRFLLDTGCRKGELEQLKDHWITQEDDGRWFLDIPAFVTKTGKARTVPLTSRVADMLPYLRLHGKRDALGDQGLFLFPYRDGFLWQRWQTIIRDVHKSSNIDLSDFVLHSFRHTTVTRLLEAGLAIDRVADWVGHSDVSITHKTYRHSNKSWLVAGAEALECR
ncbi:site-specific integrase [Brevundimonas sp.]|uniref:tyrosine-type recombinase/integrase n=1 Tax=Brevundimonas sp. TaxID=1871086 RepID=UPI00289D01EE|nr:site-specific integrase [Brevundimonas sp.]